MERSTLITRLGELLPVQFDELLFRLRIPPQYISQGAPQVTRAIEALRYLEQQGRQEELVALLDGDERMGSSDRAGSGQGLKNSMSAGGAITESIIIVGSSNHVNAGDCAAPHESASSPQALKILFLGATPNDANRLTLGKEVREISRNLRESDGGRRFQLEQEWAVRPMDLQKILLHHRPQIVHFSGHGTQAGALVFEDDQGHAMTAPVGAVGRLFSILGKDIRCVLLNACYSESQAAAIQACIPCVVGMKDALPDRAAIAFASSFYLGLGHGESVQTAFDMGCNQIEFSGVPGADLPVLRCMPGVDPAALKFIPPAPMANSSGS